MSLAFAKDADFDNKVNHNFAFKSIKQKEGDENTLVITGFANTTTKDRAGDVIPRETWEKFEAFNNYNKNPIILFNHDWDRPIGKMLSYNITEMGLEVTVEISKGADGNIYQLIKDGVLKAFSVSFYINDAKYISETDTFYITELEMLELSVVSIPCNADSIFSVVKSLGLNCSRKDLMSGNIPNDRKASKGLKLDPYDSFVLDKLLKQLI